MAKEIFSSCFTEQEMEEEFFLFVCLLFLRYSLFQVFSLNKVVTELLIILFFYAL